MKYRAKITKIQGWVEEHYNLNAYTFVKDAKDVYIEVDNEDEAELLESLEKIERQRFATILEWYNKYYTEKY